MSYRTLAACVHDLERTGQLVSLPGIEVDPYLELASIQRRAYRKGGPALLFPRVKGCAFPVLANLYGTRERIHYIFRKTLSRVEALLRAKADPMAVLRRPWQYVSAPATLFTLLPKAVRTGAVLANRTRLSSLPQLVSWPGDGGAYVTLPLVYSEHPEKPGLLGSNLGMYRVQISGNDFTPDREAGLHYQIHRGIGPHHSAALARGEDLPVNVFIGGPPAMTLAAVMPLPEGVPELSFAGALAGRRITMVMPGAKTSFRAPLLAEADFCICGRLRTADGTARIKPEGPFGDHLGYYSLTHDFPVLAVDAVYHRDGAVWPFTSVGRPPQEDTEFGAFIHELTAGLVPTVFSGVHEVHAVDAAGVHPLLLAIGSERYTPFARDRIPQELLTCGFSLLGATQTSLAKYLLIAAKEDAPALHTKNVKEFFDHMLQRTDFSRDLHILTRTTIDTLDYSGRGLNEGSKLLWAAAGPRVRRLATAMPTDFSLSAGFSRARLFAPGILVCQGPGHEQARGCQDEAMHRLARHLSRVLRPDKQTAEASFPPLSGLTDISLRSHDIPSGYPERPAGNLPEEIALVVVADNSEFVCRDWDNFLWTTFTRSDPATDLYGVEENIFCKHWGCSAPLLIDARIKPFHAPPLEENPEVEARIDAWGAPGGPLHGLV